MRRSLRELVGVFGREDLPTIGEVDPYLLGATSSVFGGPDEHGVRDRYVARTANQVDARLAEALTGCRMVIVVGPSKAGKTRTLFEAVRAYDPAVRVVWPVHDGIGELAVHPRLSGSEDPVVVWLDDLHEYLSGTNSLTPAGLAGLTARRGRTLVVATLRSEMRAQIKSEGELQRDTRLLLEQALLIDLASTSEDPYEQAAAIRLYPGQISAGHGLGEALAGAPELLARYDDAKATDPVQHSVIAVAIDWARIGRPDPIPELVLTGLTVRRMRVNRPEIDITSETVRAAITGARTPPTGAGRAAALHTSYLNGDDTRGYRPFDYLVAADDGQGHRTPRPIPDTFWDTATHDSDTDVLISVANTAYQRDNKTSALALLRRAVITGHVGAMANLGVLLYERGEITEAEYWYRKAADVGDFDAMYNLGGPAPGAG
ncbi:tetratricopeptide repeat protein [Nocardia sp. 2YAB30]